MEQVATALGVSRVCRQQNGTLAVLQARSAEHLMQLLRAGQHASIGSLRGPLKDAWGGSQALCNSSAPADGGKSKGDGSGAKSGEGPHHDRLHHDRLRGSSFAPQPYDPATGESLPLPDVFDQARLAERSAQIACLPAWLRNRRLGNADLLRITRRCRQIFFVQPVPAPTVRVEVATDVPAGLGIGGEADLGFETEDLPLDENGNVMGQRLNGADDTSDTVGEDEDEDEDEVELVSTAATGASAGKSKASAGRWSSADEGQRISAASAAALVDGWLNRGAVGSLPNECGPEAQEQCVLPAPGADQD